jgi:hypothetical protein
MADGSLSGDSWQPNAQLGRFKYLLQKRDRLKDRETTLRQMPELKEGGKRQHSRALLYAKSATFAPPA